MKNTYHSLSIVITLFFSVQVDASIITEPPDLTPSLNNPFNIGRLSSGRNSVSGSISCADFVDDCADSFEFLVPNGLIVNKLELIISNFMNSERAGARVRNFSGGTSVERIRKNITFSNLVTIPSGLVSGIYDIQIHDSRDTNSLLDPIGSVSFNWRFNISTVSSPNSVSKTTTVPEPASIWLIGSALIGFIGLHRKR